MQFDGSINTGQIISIATLVIGFGAFIWRQSSTWSEYKGIMLAFGVRMTNVESEVKKQTEILIQLGNQELRMGNAEKRIESHDHRIDQLMNDLGTIKVQYAIDTARNNRDAIRNPN